VLLGGVGLGRECGGGGGGPRVGVWVGWRGRGVGWFLRGSGGGPWWGVRVGFFVVGGPGGGPGVPVCVAVSGTVVGVRVRGCVLGTGFGWARCGGGYGRAAASRAWCRWISSSVNSAVSNILWPVHVWIVM
jgi:hypothetical protein